MFWNTKEQQDKLETYLTAIRIETVERKRIEKLEEEKARKSRNEYIALRWTWSRPELINYSDEEISEFMQMWFNQNKESVRDNLIINK